MHGCFLLVSAQGQPKAHRISCDHFLFARSSCSFALPLDPEKWDPHKEHQQLGSLGSADVLKWCLLFNFNTWGGQIATNKNIKDSGVE